MSTKNDYIKRARKLKCAPCPFCGGVPELRTLANSGYAVVCSTCGGRTKVAFFCGSKETALKRVVQKWNMRTPLKAGESINWEKIFKCFVEAINTSSAEYEPD